MVVAFTRLLLITKLYLMKKNNSRHDEKFFIKTLIYSKLLLKVAYSLIRGEVSLKLVYLHIYNKLFYKPKLNDDFDWNRYHVFYSQELIDGGKNFSLIIKDNFIIKKDKVIKKKNVLDLHPNHKLLYETILKLNPKDILEVGCGGGDHLANLSELNKKFKLFGIDRSNEQLQILKKRHPNLKIPLQIKDITKKNSKIKKVDLIYTQAVLMHISETKNRFNYALQNILKSSKKHIIFIENWKSHHFLNEINEIIENNKKFKSYKLYFTKLDKDESVTALVLSKSILPFLKLTNYKQLLQGNSLRTH
tara:strand:+ start:706 stop:1620 length:915 start_codon:yes stop_codon:yes gene_type:complete